MCSSIRGNWWRRCDISWFSLYKPIDNSFQPYPPCCTHTHTHYLQWGHVCAGLHRHADAGRDPVQAARRGRDRDVQLCRAADLLWAGSQRRDQLDHLRQVPTNFPFPALHAYLSPSILWEMSGSGGKAEIKGSWVYLRPHGPLAPFPRKNPNSHTFPYVPLSLLLFTSPFLFRSSLLSLYTLPFTPSLPPSLAVSITPVAMTLATSWESSPVRNCRRKRAISSTSCPTSSRKSTT